MKGAPSSVAATVRDGRGKDLTLDTHSFQLVEQTTSLSTKDFYNAPDKITDVYYKEMAELFKKATGAAHAHVLHHQVRNQQKENSDGEGFNTSVQPYAHGIHSDTSAHAAQQMFLLYANGVVDKKYCKGRFLYINAWRNISDAPIEDNALAVCDETSLVKPDDYIGSDLYMPGGSRIMQYRLGDRNAARHRWYYYSKMKKDEVLLFKQWDSDPTLPGRLTFHTAFSDPNAPKGAPPRESIECRAVLYFPDHEPNTCPQLPSEEPVAQATGEVNEEEVQAAVKKVIGLVPTMPTWPAFAKVWVKSTLKKKDGEREVPKAIADDKRNHHGFLKYSAAQKARIVEVLMESAFPHMLRSTASRLEVVKPNHAARLRTLATFVVGVIVGRMLTRIWA